MNSDFKVIPGYSKYEINEKGVVRNIKKDCILTGSVNPAGYHLFRLTDDSGKTLTWGRHRLLCWIFKNPGCDISNLYVNHLNGIKGSDELDNLEWVTPTENVEHAGKFGLSSKCIAIEVLHTATGKTHYFASIRKCAEFIGISKDSVIWRLRSGSSRICQNGYQYRLGDSVGAWPAGISEIIELKYVKTGNIVEFNNLKSLAVYLGVNQSVITLWINAPNMPVLPGFIQLRMKSSGEEWRPIKDPIVELAKYSGTRAVSATNVATGTILKYHSTAACAKAFDCKITTLNNRLKNSLTVNGFRFSYYCPLDL